jgi:hypothetical protein
MQRILPNHVSFPSHFLRAEKRVKPGPGRIFDTLALLTLLILCASLVPASPAGAAGGDFLWAKGIGGPSDDSGSDVVVDSAGNVYMTGGFQDTVDFDPGPGTHNLTSLGIMDIFVTKFDSSGNFVWVRRMGGTDYDEGYTISLDLSGNVYTTGTFAGTADFDPGAGVTNLSDPNGGIFISRLDSNGNFVWAKQLGTGEGYSITVDSGGNVYTTGYGTGDFDPGPGAHTLSGFGSNDIFISKLNSSGSFVWAKGMGGTGIDDGWDILVDSSGNVYTTGHFQNTVDFDPGAATFNLTSAGNYDAFLSKLDSSGNFLWAKRIGGTDIDFSFGIALDSSGNIYRTGRFTGTVDFDPGAGVVNLTSNGADIYVAKHDNNGNFLWAKSMGGTGNDQAGYIALDASGNIYLGGGFFNTVDFDPGPGTYNLTSAGMRDLFAAKLDANGNFLWAKGMGGPNDEFGLSIALAPSGDLYTSGIFSGTADLDPGTGTFNLTSAGGDDLFLSKLERDAVFGDVPSSYWAQEFIERLYAAGITGGCATGPLRYCPEDTVTRAQMAVFLLRGIHGAAYSPPAVGATTGFDDVPLDYWAAAWIKQMAAEGITGGCGAGTYCPEAPVTRAQMAVFLLRSKYGAAYTPPAVGSSTGFSDVPTTYWASAWIKQLVTEGITSGCGTGTYCPESPVTRAQMAVFLVRTFNLP